MDKWKNSLIKLILSLIQLKRAYESKLVEKSELKNIRTFLDIKNKSNIDFDKDEYDFLANLLSNFWINEIIYYFSYYKDFNINNLDLNILVSFIKQEKIWDFLSIKDSISLRADLLKEKEQEDEFSLDDDKLSLTYDRFANFDGLLDFWQTTLLLAPRTWGWKTTLIMNIILDAIENNPDVKFLYFWTKEVTKEEFRMKLGSIMMAENLMDKYKRKKKLKSIVRKSVLTWFQKIIDKINNFTISNSNKEEVLEILNDTLKNIKNNIKRISAYYISKKVEMDSLTDLVKILTEDTQNILGKLSHDLYLDDYMKKTLIEVKQQKEIAVDNYKKQISEIQKDFNSIWHFIEDIKSIEWEINNLKINLDSNIEDLNEAKWIMLNVLSLFETFNKEYNKFVIQKEKELLDLENELKEKKSQIINKLGDKVYLETKEEIKIEDIQDAIDKHKNEDVMVIIDYLQMMTSNQKFPNEMAMFQYISSRILSLSKLPNTNIGFIIASQAASKRDAKILTEDDVKGFKNVINTMANAISVYNMEGFIPENEKEEGRRKNKKSLTIVNVIKARDGAKSYNKYYIYNSHTNKLEPLTWEEEKILFKENIFSRWKVDVKIAYYDDLKETFEVIEWQNNDSNNDNIPDLWTLSQKSIWTNNIKITKQWQNATSAQPDIDDIDNILNDVI